MIDNVSPHPGIEVTMKSAGLFGVLVESSDTDGVWVQSVGYNGVVVGSANRDAIVVEAAGRYARDFNGRVRASSLEITAGSDLAETFNVVGGRTVGAGTIVAIDPAQTWALADC